MSIIQSTVDEFGNVTNTLKPIETLDEFRQLLKAIRSERRERGITVGGIAIETSIPRDAEWKTRWDHAAGPDALDAYYYTPPLDGDPVELTPTEAVWMSQYRARYIEGCFKGEFIHWQSAIAPNANLQTLAALIRMDNAWPPQSYPMSEPPPIS